MVTQDDGEDGSHGELVWTQELAEECQGLDQIFLVVIVSGIATLSTLYYEDPPSEF